MTTISLLSRPACIYTRTETPAVAAARPVAPSLSPCNPTQPLGSHARPAVALSDAGSTDPRREARTHAASHVRRERSLAAVCSTCTGRHAARGVAGAPAGPLGALVQRHVLHSAIFLEMTRALVVATHYGRLRAGHGTPPSTAQCICRACAVRRCDGRRRGAGDGLRG